MNNSCPECGYPLEGNELYCPECGYPLQNTSNQHSDYQAVQPQTQQPFSANVHSQTQINEAKEKTDWANYIYECGLIMWKVFTQKYANPYGRASRREFWSFSILAALFSTTIITFLILVIPWICVCIRRMHDVNKCGWWSCVPIACFFLYLKKSDEGVNRYGNPEPAKNLL